MSGALTKEQRDHYAEHGFLVLPEAFNPTEVRRMREEADRILELIINSSLANKRRSGRLDICDVGDGDLMVRKIQPINDLSLYLAEISQDERFLGPMRELMGDDPMLMEEKLNYKTPLGARIPEIEAKAMEAYFPIHSDWAYYKSQDYPQTVMSSAICMDACTPESGPIRVWRGTHKEHIEHERYEIGLQVKPGSVDFEGGEDVLAPAGSVMLFSSLLIHNSRGNRSGRPRRLMIYSHFPKCAKMGFDVRNSPTRMRESPWEWEYIRRKTIGEYQDRFHAPKFD
ncbi:MAG: phytanoyl-CoA dioxygenase family protein [Candidatus Poribacteria bacterium]|nr:phytanoyl-CoA dioxygenase family protein [Candidatus Poribacteria bacterium]